MKKAFIITILAILLTACSGDLPASEPTLSSAYIPAASPSPIHTPMPTPTPLPTPVPTSEPSPEPVFTQPPYAEFDGSLPYWTMFYEYGPEMLAEYDWYKDASGYSPAVFENLAGTHTGVEIRDALHETTWESLAGNNYDEQHWVLSRSYDIEIAEAQTFYVDGELCETRTVTIMDMNIDSVSDDYAVGYTLYFIRQYDAWLHPTILYHSKDALDNPEPLEDADDEAWLAQDAGQRDVYVMLTNHRQTDNATWTRVDLLSLTDRTPPIGYYTNVEAENDDGWRIESNAVFDYRTADEGIIHLTVRQDAFNPEGKPQCGVTHYIEYEWSDIGNLERRSYRVRFDDGYEADYGATDSFRYYNNETKKWPTAQTSRYEPIKVPDLPEDATGLEKYFEPKSGAGIYPMQASTTDNLLSMNPALAVDYLSKRCGAHRNAPQKVEYEQNTVNQFLFTLTLENTEHNAAWITYSKYDFAFYVGILLIEYDEGWKIAAMRDIEEYEYVLPYIAQSPDGQTAWFVDGWNNGKRGDGYISWYNLVTGTLDVEYTSVYPDEAMYSTYEFITVESLEYRPESNYDVFKGYPFVRIFDTPLVIKGNLRGFDGVAVYTDYKFNYSCEYEHTFVYAPETRSLVIQERKIKTSEGFTYGESFPLPGEFAPR